MESKQSVVSRRTLLKAGVLFFMFNSIFLLILSSKYVFFIPDEVYDNSRFYVSSLLVSHFIFLAFIPFFFVYLPLTILTKNRRVSMFVASISMTLTLLVFLIDSYVYSLYRFHLNKYVFEQLLGPGAGQVFELSISLYLLAVTVLVVAVIIEILIFKGSYRLAQTLNARYLYVVCGVLVLIGLSAHLTHACAAARKDNSILSVDRCFPLCYPLNANKLLETVGLKKEEKSMNLNFLDKKYNYPKSTLSAKQGTKNIVMIVLDSWSYKDYDSIVTPNIYKFSKKGQVCTYHYSGCNGTRGGIFSLFYGLPSIYWYDFMDQNIAPVFVKELAAQKYDVRLFPSASMQNPAFDKNVFCLYADQCVSAVGDKAWERDENLAKNFVKFVNGRQENSNPFFSLLFFDSMHSMIVPDGYKGPFQPSWSYPKYEALSNDTDPSEFRNLYKNMAFYIDSIVGSVIRNLEEKDLLKNTVVIITGDHSQEFNENGKGFWGHNGNYSEAQLRVPMIYVNPDFQPSVCDCWTSHFDVVPTLMQDVFSVPNPTSDYSMGKSLHDTTARTSLLVDSYIGFGIVDTVGNITNVYYDNTIEMVDRNLNARLNASVDTVLLEKTLQMISSFYKN